MPGLHTERSRTGSKQRRRTVPALPAHSGACFKAPPGASRQEECERPACLASLFAPSTVLHAPHSLWPFPQGSSTRPTAHAMPRLPCEAPVATADRTSKRFNMHCREEGPAEVQQAPTCASSPAYASSASNSSRACARACGNSSSAAGVRGGQQVEVGWDQSLQSLASGNSSSAAEQWRQVGRISVRGIDMTHCMRRSGSRVRLGTAPLRPGQGGGRLRRECAS